MSYDEERVHDASKKIEDVKIEKMELAATKDGRPMFKVQCRILDGEFKKWCLFMNRVIYGTKNDANMIASVLGWLDKLGSETIPEFKNYSQFAENVLDKTVYFA